jgi:hypothetical protein
MPDILADYKIQLDAVRKLIRVAKSFDAATSAVLDLHAATHSAKVSDSTEKTLSDDLLNGLADADFSVMPTKKDETIAWHLWHIARIEDLVSNLLIAEQDQVFNDGWMNRMHVTVKDVGNSMTDEEIFALSETVDKRALIDYRDAVGIQTRRMIKALTLGDLKRKPSETALSRLVAEGGLLEEKGSIWLKKFWGSYTVQGLLLLPLTYHHMLHLPDSFAIKAAVKAKG